MYWPISEESKRIMMTAFAPIAVALRTSRSTACRRVSSKSWVYSWISPPAMERRLARMLPPSPRERTTTPNTWPNVCFTRCPATRSVVATSMPTSFAGAQYAPAGAGGAIWAGRPTLRIVKQGRHRDGVRGRLDRFGFHQCTGVAGAAGRRFPDRPLSRAQAPAGQGADRIRFLSLCRHAGALRGVQPQGFPAGRALLPAQYRSACGAPAHL